MRLLFACFVVFICACGSKTTSPAPAPAPAPKPTPIPKPIPQTCSLTGVTEQKCDYKQYTDGYCAWNPNSEKCGVIKDCSDIPTRSICDSNFPRELGGCTWQVQDGPCFKPDEGGCKILSNTNFGGGKDPCEAKTGCYWTPAQGSQTEGECQLATSCSQISKGACDHVNSISGGPCYFDTASNTCKQAKNCGDFKSSDQCPVLIPAVTAVSQAEQFCWWNNTACTQAAKCEDITIDAQCGRQSTTLYCGWNSAGNKCEVVCGNIKDSTTCGQYNQCGWDLVNEDCAPKGTTCGQNSSSTDCSASPLNCAWNGTQCVPGACNQNPSVTCNTQTSEQSCSQIGCTWTACSSVTTSSACTGACEWAVTNPCVSRSASQCAGTGCLVCSTLNSGSQGQCTANSGCEWAACYTDFVVDKCPVPPECVGPVTAKDGGCLAPDRINNNSCYATNSGGCGGTSTEGVCQAKSQNKIGNCAGQPTNCRSVLSKSACTQAPYNSFCQWGMGEQ